MESYAGESRNDSLDLLFVANKRKPNFTEGESLYLISQFERNATVLTSKLNDASTNKQKVEVWKRICGDYNSKNPIVLRTANDLKRKWKNMVRAAKKELLETMTAPSENGHGEQSVSHRKLSPVSQRIVEILRITATNCGTLASPGLENTFDSSFAEDQGEMETDEDGSGESETKTPRENGLQHVVHVVVGPQDVKPQVLASSGINTEQTEDSQQHLNGESHLSLHTPAADRATTQATDPVQGSSTVAAKSGQSSVPVSVVSVSSIPAVRQMPSTSSASRIGNPGRQHRVLLPQQKRMLPSSFSHVIKKRKLSEYGQDESLSHVRAEVEKLKKEKLMLEKEKLALEKEKLIMEKEKLALEIRFLRDQMD